MSPGAKPHVCPQCGRSYSQSVERCAQDGAPLLGPEVLARIGQEVGGYKIHKVVGEGGMGVVYRAEHILLQKPVAIKILHDRYARRKGAANHFLREARAASRIRHPNIVDVTDFGKAEDGSIYFVMEFLEGESLEEVLARDVRLPLFKTVNVVSQIASALAAAHDHGIIHQDLKPENIFLISREGRRRVVRRVPQSERPQFVVEPEGRFDFVKLLDFGVAKFNEDNLGPGLSAKTGMVFGTPHYMSPEQCRGAPSDARSDIYALGILFYEMLLGVVPFDSDSALEILNGHVSGEVVPPRERDPTIEIDAGTNSTILRCLEKSPKNRYQSMDELLSALRDCFTDTVFLRDAGRLPGAVQAGIVPPESRPTQQRSPDEPSLGEGEGEPRLARMPAAPGRNGGSGRGGAAEEDLGGQEGRNGVVLLGAKNAAEGASGGRLTDELAELLAAEAEGGGGHVGERAADSSEDGKETNPVGQGAEGASSSGRLARGKTDSGRFKTYQGLGRVNPDRKSRDTEEQASGGGSRGRRKTAPISEKFRKERGR